MRVVWSDLHRRHDPPEEVEAGERQPMREHPGRVEQILDALRADRGFELVLPAGSGRDPIDAVHDPAMVDYLEIAWHEWSAAAGRDLAIPDVFLHPRLHDGMDPPSEPQSPLGRLGYWCFETTTPMVEGTYAAARAAVDCAVTATQLVLDGGGRAFALCRPPGHHAAHAVFGGYCFLNNAAIAAQHASDAGAGRVAILDVDYHHGNGTQQIFYARRDVLYVSLHGDPARAYPYFTGHAGERGSGEGTGTTLNLPLPSGCDDTGFLAALERGLGAVVDHGAEILVVSLGLDTWRGDPLGDLALSTGGFADCGAAVRSLGLPTTVVLEGGYAVGALGQNVVAWLRGLDGRAPEHS
jgi:acetoin utilization deacetylase AcuC-like enzyme